MTLDKLKLKRRETDLGARASYILVFGTVVFNGFEFNCAAPVRNDPVLGLEIDPDFLLKDIKKARWDYLRDLRAAKQRRVIRRRRFRQVFET